MNILPALLIACYSSAFGQTQEMSGSAAAPNQRPSLYIECQLRIAMDCENLRRAYFDRLKVIDRIDNESALIRIKLSDETSPLGTLVHAKWSARTIIDAPLPDLLLPPHYDSNMIQSALITLITQPVAAIIRIESGKGLEELVIQSLSGGEPTPEDTSTSPYFADISMSGSAFKSGIGAMNPDGSAGPATSNANASTSLSLNRTTKRTRYSAGFFGFYTNSSQPGPNGSTVSADNFSRVISLVGVYSIDESSIWNIALVATQRGDRGANIKGAANAAIGLEYNLVPFRVDQPYEFRVRTSVSTNYDRMVLPNDRGKTQEEYYNLGAQLYTFWLILKNKASINASLAYATNLSYRGYTSAAASASFNYQISRTITFNTSASYTYTKKNINFPAAPDFSNPIQTQYLSGYAGGSYSTSIGVSFRIGKGGLLLNRDRRFN